MGDTREKLLLEALSSLQAYLARGLSSEEKGLLERVGTTGKGTRYRLKEQERGETGNQGATKGQIANKEELNAH